MRLNTAILELPDKLGTVSQQLTLPVLLWNQFVAFAITYQGGFTSYPSYSLIPIIQVSNLLGPLYMEILILENRCLAAGSLIERGRIFISRREYRLRIFTVT